jgi:putative modified peptide
MKNQLSPEQGRELVTRLARDDAFRDGFARDPRSALARIGVPADVIDALDHKCVEARPLAPREAFEALLQDLAADEFQAVLRMSVPRARLG